MLATNTKILLEILHVIEYLPLKSFLRFPVTEITEKNYRNYWLTEKRFILLITHILSAFIKKKSHSMIPRSLNLELRNLSVADHSDSFLKEIRFMQLCFPCACHIFLISFFNLLAHISWAWSRSSQSSSSIVQMGGEIGKRDC